MDTDKGRLQADSTNDEGSRNVGTAGFQPAVSQASSLPTLDIIEARSDFGGFADGKSATQQVGNRLETALQGERILFVFAQAHDSISP